MYTLKTTFEKRSVNGVFLHDDKYISNGHFLISQDQVKDCYKFINPLGKTESWRFEHVINSVIGEKVSAFEKTEYLFDLGKLGYARIFTDKGGLNVAIQEDYVKAFNVSILYGSCPTNALKTHDEIVIMPVKLPTLFKNNQSELKIA